MHSNLRMLSHTLNIMTSLLQTGLNGRPHHQKSDFLSENGIHSVNVLQWLAQSPVASVKGFAGQCFHSKDEMDADDFGVTLIRHLNDVQSVTLVNGYRTGAPKYQLEMTCSSGMIRCERKQLWVGINNTWEERPVEAGDDKAREWAAFLDCIETDGEPASPAREGRETVRIMEAVIESGRTGREVVFQ